MRENIFGSFIFYNYGDGCISSKYLEHSQRTSFVESAKRTNNPDDNNDPFVGIFRTTWIELVNDVLQINDAVLTIESSDDVYDLIWSNGETNAIIYEGTANLINGQLVGTYWMLRQN